MGTAKPQRLQQQDERFGAEGGTPWGSGAGTKHSWLVALAELASSACLGCHTHLGCSHLGCCSPPPPPPRAVVAGSHKALPPPPPHSSGSGQGKDVRRLSLSTA